MGLALNPGISEICDNARRGSYQLTRFTAQEHLWNAGTFSKVVPSPESQARCRSPWERSRKRKPGTMLAKIPRAPALRFLSVRRPARCRARCSIARWAKPEKKFLRSDLADFTWQKPESAKTKVSA